MKFINYFILFFLFSCSSIESNDEEIQLLVAGNADSTTKSKIPTNSLSFIRLETKSESLLSYIINIDITKEFCYVLDRSTLFKFNLDGSFISKIPRGKGPGEIEFPLNFKFNKERNEIYIIEMGNKLHVYDNNLNYKRTFILDGSFVDVLRLDDDHFLLCSALVGDYEPYLVSKFSIKNESIVEKYLSMDNNPMKDLHILTFNNFQIFNDNIYLTVSNSRFIYEFNDNKMSSVYQISFNNYEPPLEYIKRFRKTRAFRKITYKDQLVSFVNFYYQFKEFALLGIKHKKYNCGIKFKDDNSIYLSDISYLFDLPTTKSFEMPRSFGENKIHFIYNNDILHENNQLKESSLLYIRNDSLLIRQNENPIIVTISIK